VPEFEVWFFTLYLAPFVLRPTAWYLFKCFRAFRGSHNFPEPTNSSSMATGFGIIGC